MKLLTITLNPAFDIHYEMDSFELGKESYAINVTEDAGGKGINTARTLITNGYPCKAYVILGKENGNQFIETLEKQNISFNPIWVDGRIRQNITIHPKQGKETRISLDTFAITNEKLEELLSLLKKEKLNDCLISFSGRLPKGITKIEGLNFVKSIIKEGAKVIVDSNSFNVDDLKEIHPWLIKPNEQEISTFFNRSITSKEDALTIAKEMVKEGISEQVIISMGGDGSVYSDGINSYIVSVPKLNNPVSTIGAGDSTIAGFLAGQLKNLNISETLKLAFAFGTASCLTVGTNPPKNSDIEKTLKEIQLLK